MLPTFNQCLGFFWISILSRALQNFWYSRMNSLWTKAHFKFAVGIVNHSIKKINQSINHFLQHLNYLNSIRSYFNFLSSHTVQQIPQKLLAVLLLETFEPGSPEVVIRSISQWALKRCFTSCFSTKVHNRSCTRVRGESRGSIQRCLARLTFYTLGWTAPWEWQPLSWFPGSR